MEILKNKDAWKIWKKWKSWKKLIFEISIGKKHGNAKEQTWFSPSIAQKIWKCGNHGRYGKSGFSDFN